VTTRTPAQRGKANQSKGKVAERHLANYLREWWPEARRAVVTGSSVRGGDGLVREQPDPGDVAGVPGVIWSVKDCGVEQIEPWLAELDAMATLAGETAALRFLVHKRRGCAPERWWAWQRAGQYAGLFGGRSSLTHPVRVEVRHLVADLLAAGYAPQRQVGGAA
jgi:hypothetical protein